METPTQEPLLQTNLDTDLLKLIAICSMLFDHVGSAFFPQYPVFRWIGRLAFPIFCYCMTVGLLYTHDIKKYLLRLAVFAFVSQPFYILATHPYDWQTEWMNLNIFFTLFFSLLAMWGFQEKKWWLTIAVFALMSLINFDYSSNGIILMMIFYLSRNHPISGAAVYVLYWLPALWRGDPADPRSLMVAGHAVNWTVFGMLSALPIFLRTHSGIRVPKWFFYGFYPAHLALIGIVRILLGV